MNSIFLKYSINFSCTTQENQLKNSEHVKYDKYSINQNNCELFLGNITLSMQPYIEIEQIEFIKLFFQELKTEEYRISIYYDNTKNKYNITKITFHNGNMEELLGYINNNNFFAKLKFDINEINSIINTINTIQYFNNSCITIEFLNGILYYTFFLEINDTKIVFNRVTGSFINKDILPNFSRFLQSIGIILNNDNTIIGNNICILSSKSNSLPINYFIFHDLIDISNNIVQSLQSLGLLTPESPEEEQSSTSSELTFPDTFNKFQKHLIEFQKNYLNKHSIASFQYFVDCLCVCNKEVEYFINYDVFRYNQEKNLDLLMNIFFKIHQNFKKKELNLRILFEFHNGCFFIKCQFFYAINMIIQEILTITDINAKSIRNSLNHINGEIVNKIESMFGLPKIYEKYIIKSLFVTKYNILLEIKDMDGYIETIQIHKKDYCEIPNIIDKFHKCKNFDNKKELKNLMKASNISVTFSKNK